MWWLGIAAVHVQLNVIEMRLIQPDLARYILKPNLAITVDRMTGSVGSRPCCVEEDEIGCWNTSLTWRSTRLLVHVTNTDSPKDCDRLDAYNTVQKNGAQYMPNFTTEYLTFEMDKTFGFSRLELRLKKWPVCWPASLNHLFYWYSTFVNFCLRTEIKITEFPQRN